MKKITLNKSFELKRWVKISIMQLSIITGTARFRDGLWVMWNIKTKQLKQSNYIKLEKKDNQVRHGFWYSFYTVENKFIPALKQNKQTITLKRRWKKIFSFYKKEQIQNKKFLKL